MRHATAAGARMPLEPLSLSEAATLISALQRELGRVIIGQHTVIGEILVAFLAGGHCLLRGVPGLAKTLLIKTLADAVHLKFSRIQFTPDLMPSDITYNAITTDFWQNLDATSGKESWEMFGTTGDAKGQPVQINHPSHGSPWVRIRRIMVGAAYS